MRRDIARRRERSIRDLGQRVFAGRPLHVVDVGALWGLQPQLAPLSSSVEALAFDPSPEECARLNSRAASEGLRQRFLPVAVAGADEERPFHVTRKGSSSSLLEPNAAFFAQYADPERVDVIEIQAMKTRSLGAILDEERFPLEFLKLDAHGVEPEILASIDDDAWGPALGVFVEVLFAPIYGNAATFATIDGFLQERALQPYSLRRYVGRRASFDTWRYESNGRLVFGDLLYLRDPETLSDEARPRLAAVAACFGHHDLALELFEAAGDGAAADLVRAAAARPGPLQRRLATKLLRLGAVGRARYGLPAGHWTGDDEMAGV